jgi:sigma-B regulation protein RsbU (phosphoserine phosphatase)
MAKDMIEQNKTQREIEIVGEIQKSLLSKNKKEPFPLAGINIPAKIISGDFYNFNDLGNGKYGFGVADVSGKGIKSSLLMSKASSLYSFLSKNNFSPANLLIQLNNEICETISRGMFVTMLIGVYDSNTEELLLSNAGHEQPIILDKDNNFSNFTEAGPPLGIMPKVQYKEFKLSFVQSTMYIFTDGITEIKNSEGKELESEGFQKYIIKFKDKPINERLKLIVDNILNSKYIQKDDLTIAVIESK